MRQADFTLSAGPTTAANRVLAAQSSPIIYHYDPAFIEEFKRTERKVGEVYRTNADIVLMQGEAILGLEAAARAVVRPGMPCLNLASGVFGKGFGYWLKSFGAELFEIEVPYNDSIDPADVERELREHPEIELVSVVHVETPSGTINPVDAICRIAKAHGAITIVDAAASLGGIPIWPDESKVDICVGAAQKCLSGPPGISLMSVSSDAWEVIGKNPYAPRDSYLSILDWKEKWLENGRFPYTPSVSDIHGIEAACDEILEEGLEASFERHEHIAEACRAGVKAMGLELWPRSEEIAAASVTAVALPDDLNDIQIREYVHGRYGVMLSGGQGAGNLVRIGHMGVTARSVYPVIGLSALGRALADHGVQVRIGEGLEAALAVLAGTPTAAASL
jgi:pyridoxamine--pyruvate transaminase